MGRRRRHGSVPELRHRLRHRVSVRLSGRRYRFPSSNVRPLVLSLDGYLVFRRENLTKALQDIGLRPKRCLFDELASAYGQSHRAYHNADHVTECLAALRKHRHLAERPAEVEVAIWFHDAVYETRRPDNEEASARWARNYLEHEGAEESTIDRIEQLILATKSHVAESADAEILLDIDLGVLGQEPQVFEAYDENIRREYDWVPEEAYRAGRRAILQGFLARSHIYCTDDFRRAFEAQARRNLQRKLAELSDG